MPYLIIEPMEKTFDIFSQIFGSIAHLAEYLLLFVTNAPVECDFSFLFALKNAPELSSLNNIMHREMELVYKSRQQIHPNNPKSLAHLFFSFRTICNLYELLYENLLLAHIEICKNKNIKEIVEMFPEIFPDDFLFTLHEFKKIVTSWADAPQALVHAGNPDFAHEFDKIKTIIYYKKTENNNVVHDLQNDAQSNHRLKKTARYTVPC